MHTNRRDVAATAERVRGALQDLAGWSAWLPGCLSAIDDPQPDGTRDVTLRLRAPRTLALRISVEMTEEGIRYALIEGDVSAASGTVAIAAKGEGAEITWEQEIAFSTPVPRPLLRELEDEVVPRWLAALAAHAEALSS